MAIIYSWDSRSTSETSESSERRAFCGEKKLNMDGMFVREQIKAYGVKGF